ncbi:hypothetical protein QA645_38445 [Bradyrhizobium sp. CIAT3101]|uniref:hypothetical protein n=1 Tax=Bradyrhizobium sp. CIAT3101 TaxID=439387 RepID=UPI0024B26085|nr:hypothetical protein [Bradyrhizobium sp. CIAT3101]WFU80318.1 hypothetical protein QA645_38445 [Bradyrhizobium sp. CIAT3101]
MRTLPLVLVVAAMAAFGAKAGAEAITSCTQSGTCFCVNADLLPAIQERVTTIRARLSSERTTGKATGYISIPISTLEGSYLKVNLDVASDVKQRLETKFGANSLWMLNPGEKSWTLPDGAGGADYMLMWTRVLEGAAGDGSDFDFVYFTGPDDFKRGLRLADTDVMAQLEAEYDKRAADDPQIKVVDKRLFRNYYALRASVAFSLGSHDEWNIVRGINERRRHAGPAAIARQWAVWFDGQPVSPSQYETQAAPGYAGNCPLK